TVLKRDGRLQRSGRCVLLAIAAWLLLTADTGVVRFFAWRAVAVERRLPGWDHPQERAAGLRELDELLARAASFALVDDPEFHQQRGPALRDLFAATGDQAAMSAAEAQLRRAVELQPDWVSALVPLADVLHQRDADDEAEALLRRALKGEPDSRAVQQRLQAIERARGR